MGKNYIFLVMLLISSFSFGQQGQGEIYEQDGIVFTYSSQFIKTIKSKDYIYSNGVHTCEQQLDLHRVTISVKNNTPEMAVFTNDSFIQFIGADYKSPNCEQITRGFDGWPMVFLAAGGGVFMDLGGGREYQNTIDVLTLPGIGFTLKRYIKNREKPYVKPEFGDWKTFPVPDCNSNLEYKVLHTGNGWGGQTDVFQVKSNNDKTVSFVFQLLDANGKVHFGDNQTVNPGQTIQFEHKMQSDVRIKSYRLLNFIFTSTGKLVCGASGEEELETLKKRKYELCQELGGVLGNIQNTVFNNNCKNIAFVYTVKDLNKLKNEVAILEGELAYQKGAVPQRKQEDERKTGEFNELIAEKEKLCIEFHGLSNSTGITSQSAENVCSMEYKRDDLILLKNYIPQLRAEITKLKQQKEDEERKRKEQEEKFNSLISQGDNSFSSKKYDSAMGYYSQAKNIAANESQKQIASQKYNQASDAKRTAERQDRIKAQDIRDKDENLAYTSLATGAVGVMSLINDQYAHEGSSAKFQIGLGYEQTPMITNQTNQYAAAASYSDKASYPLIHLGLNLEFLNKKAINFNVRPIASIGIDAFSTGTSGTYVATGVESGLRFWYKSHTKFKLFADIGWYERVGDKTADKDAQSGGTTATDEVKEGKYSYHVLRYGGGPMLHLRHDGRETWIKPGVYFEKLTFAKYDKPTMSFILSANIESEIILEAAYSKNYPVAGTISYPNAFTYSDQNYFSIKIIRQGKIW